MTSYIKNLTFHRRKYEGNDRTNHPHERRQRDHHHRTPTSQLPTKQEQGISTAVAPSMHRQPATRRRLAGLGLNTRPCPSYPTNLQFRSSAPPGLATRSRMEASVRISDSEPAPRQQTKIRSSSYALVFPVGDCVREKGAGVERC